MSSEVDVILAVQRAAGDNEYAPKVARGLSHFGEHALGWFALSAVGAAVDAQRRTRWLEIGASAFTAHAASVVIKRIVRRKRPHDPRIRVGVSTPSTLSFPSSHASSTTAALVSLSDLTGSRLPLIGVPVMMASRVLLGVHYPTDTVAGAVIGAASAKIISALASSQEDN